MGKNKITSEASEAKYTARRKIILDAALECFLQFGYAKVSLDDIAKKARLSRPLIYLLFKNKVNLFTEMLRDLHLAHVNRALPILEFNISRKDKLILIYEELLFKSWNQIMKAPKGKEFFNESWEICPQLEKEYEKETLNLLLPIFEDRKIIELFMLCVDGLCSDQPTTLVLRKRLQLLIDQFLREN